MDKEIAKMACLNGLTFNMKASTKILQEGLKKLNFDKSPPTCHVGVSNIIIRYYEKQKQELKELFKKKIAARQFFSMTLDECTIQNKRFMNLNVHETEIHYSLGVIQLFGSITATKSKELVEKRLNEFDLSIFKNIVSTTTDGASVMVKFGQNIVSDQQVCLAHAIHLVAINVLYCKPANSTVAEIDSEDEISDGEVESVEEESSVNYEEEPVLRSQRLK